MYTAIVLSKDPVTLTLPGVEILGRTQPIATLTELLDARLDAIPLVRTKFCFFLDDDDLLPENYLDVLASCAESDVAVAYTNELVDAGKGYVLSRPPTYSIAAHLRTPFLIHHLAVMNTAAAAAAAERVPRGEYVFEPLLYSALAAISLAYVDVIGYKWHKRKGLHTHPNTSAALLRTIQTMYKGVR